MRRSTISTVLSVLFLSVLVAPKQLDSGPYVGKGTWVNVTEGDCGMTDKFVLLPSASYNIEACGREVSIQNIDKGTPKYGMEVYSLIGGACRDCHGTDLVMTADLFAQLATLNTGEVKISWNHVGTPS